MSELYKMALNDILHTKEGYEILRVPGGWIYTRFSENGNGGNDMSSCFVPLSPSPSGDNGEE